MRTRIVPKPVGSEIYSSHTAYRFGSVLITFGGPNNGQDEIGQALARCGWFMVLLTPNAVKSLWVKRELNYALIERRYQDRIIPLLFKKLSKEK